MVCRGRTLCCDGASGKFSVATSVQTVVVQGGVSRLRGFGRYTKQTWRGLTLQVRLMAAFVLHLQCPMKHAGGV